ncbi:MAG: prepilin peptidase [Candidatus Diapherotrites archaeon]
MFPLIFFCISLAALAYATWSDLRSRIIPNRLTYSLIFGGLALQLLYSALGAGMEHFAVVAAVTAVTFGASYLLWRLGVWAGGDVKLMTGLAALNPVNYAMVQGILGLQLPLAGTITQPIFPLTLFLFSIFSMAPYAALISINALAKRKELRAEMMREFRVRGRQALIAGLAVAGVSAVLTYLSLPAILLLPVLIALGLVKGTAQYVIVAAAFLFALLQNPVNAAYGAGGIALGLFVLYATIKLVTMSRTKVLRQEVKITALQEGDIVAETIVENGGKAERLEGIQMQKVIKYIMGNRLEDLLHMLAPQGRVIAGPHRAAGVSTEQLEELRGLVKEKRLEDRIVVSRSAPFVPAVLIAYLVLQVAGDLLWNVLFFGA